VCPLCEQSPVDAQRLPERFSSGSVDTMASTVRSLHMSISVTQISAWGDGLALRLTKPTTKTAGYVGVTHCRACTPAQRTLKKL
jgi:hypothetical protein